MIIAALGAGLVWRGWDLARSRPTPGKTVGSISAGLLVMAFSAAAVIREAVANDGGLGLAASASRSPMPPARGRPASVSTRHESACGGGL